MKSILISIRPEWVAKILNGEKTIEIRKTAPKCDLPIDVYIYCTKEKNNYLYWDWYDPPFVTHEWFVSKNPKVFIESLNEGRIHNGKVVAKFRLRKVEELDVGNPYGEPTRSLLNEACVTLGEARTYAGGTHPRYKTLFAWHISDLEIFDEPKGLNIFLKPNWDKGLDKELERARKEDLKIIKRIENGKAFDDEIANCEELTLMGFELSGIIEKAPRSWRYVEVEE